MDLDGVWRTIDAERRSLADLLDGLSPAEWATPSLCDACRVGDVAAHLTLAHMSPWRRRSARSARGAASTA